MCPFTKNEKNRLPKAFNPHFGDQCLPGVHVQKEPAGYAPHHVWISFAYTFDDRPNCKPESAKTMQDWPRESLKRRIQTVLEESRASVLVH